MTVELICFLIRKYRIEKNFSQEYMAEELGITQSHYSKLERTGKELSLSRFLKIAKILDLEVQEFLDPQLIVNRRTTGFGK